MTNEDRLNRIIGHDLLDSIRNLGIDGLANDVKIDRVVDDVDWLIEQVRIHQATNRQLSPKLVKLNEFLQQRNTGRWGDSVIDIAMNKIVDLDKATRNWSRQYDELAKRTQTVDKKNKCYKQALEFYAKVKSHRKPIVENDHATYLGQSPIELDRGEKARQALKEGEAE